MHACFLIHALRAKLPLFGAALLGSVAVSFAPPAAVSGVNIHASPSKPVYAAGEVVTIGGMGLPNTFTILAGDTDPGPTTFPFGTVNLGFSSELIFHHFISSVEGCFSTDCTADCDSPYLGRPVYIQAVQFPQGGTPCVSNSLVLLWEDINGVCVQTNLCPGSGFKPQVLTMKYTGDSCAATSHSQAAGSVSCSGDPGFAPLVHIVSHDPPNKYIWFEGDVALNADFDIDATNAGRLQLQGETIVDIYDVNNGALLQTVQFHTSCSQPLIPGDQYGGVELVSAELVQKNP